MNSVMTGMYGNMQRNYRELLEMNMHRAFGDQPGPKKKRRKRETEYSDQGTASYVGSKKSSQYDNGRQKRATGVQSEVSLKIPAKYSRKGDASPES